MFKKNLFDLSKKTVLITGASEGIGFASAQGLALAGAEKVVLVAREVKKLNRAKKQLEKTNTRVFTFSFDLSKLEEISLLWGRIIKTTSRIDILVNNVGMTRRRVTEEVDLEEWQRVLDLNLTSVFLLSQLFARELIKKKRRGKIINITSLLAERARPTIAAYGVSKAGLSQLTKTLAVEWAKYGINVNAIGPGYIKTRLTQPLVEDEKFNQWVIRKTPQGRWGEPTDLMGTVIFLAAPASDFITGQTIYVDGGWLSNL